MELLSQLAQNSLLALLLAISYGALVFIFALYRTSQKNNDDLQEKRVQENKDNAEKYFSLANGVKQTLDTTITVLQKRK